MLTTFQLISHGDCTTGQDDFLAFSVVFEGTYELNKVTEVAIKRVEKERLDDRETTALQIVDHENVLKLLLVAKDESFWYKFCSF